MQEFKPYKNKKLDGRFKIMPEQYPEVIALHKELKSSRNVPKIFGVNKKIILFIVNHEYKKRDQLRQKNQQHWKMYYDRESHTKAIRKYRAKKRSLNLQFNPSNQS